MLNGVSIKFWGNIPTKNTVIQHCSSLEETQNLEKLIFLNVLNKNFRQR